jgi:MFS family permease
MLNESHGFFYVFCVMIVQGLSFGLLSTVGVIGVQQLVGGHERGISTSFFMFCRNMGTAIGVTIMGALLTSGGSFMAGIHHLFLFGFAGSIVALLTSLKIQNETESKHNRAAS